MTTTSYENYPIRIVVLSGAIAFSIYAIGTFILAGFGILIAALYVLYCLGVELAILKGSCVHCYYYGKVCSFGRGKLCALFFKRGDPQNFLRRQISWKEILPDLLVALVPLLGGIALLIREFSWIVAGAMVVLVLLSFGGNALVRGSFACKFCKQRELGCPAEKLFSQSRAA
ncbi:MAG: hypothetical protein FJ009_16120 [Chloroflexi bacterium]|nr:hypothetical protein [Chloroflexota bacterium]